MTPLVGKLMIWRSIQGNSKLRNPYSRIKLSAIRIKIMDLIMTSTTLLRISPTSKDKYPTLSPISTPSRKILLKLEDLVKSSRVKLYTIIKLHKLKLCEITT